MAVTYKVTASPLVAEAVSSTATGGSLTGDTVMLTVAMFESSWPSFALKVKLSWPLKSGYGE